MKPEIEYVRIGEVYVAYEVYGDGPVDLVGVPTGVANIDYAWENPEWAAFARGFGEFARVILFEPRGGGISDRMVGVPALDERMEDVRAVMDAAGSRRAVLYGSGEDAAALVVLFAATYPERVAGIVVWQPDVRGSWTPDYPWAPRDPTPPFGGTKYASREHVDVVVQHLFPSKIGDEEFAAWLRSFLRLSASPTSYDALARMNFDTDVRDVLASISAPTLVLHRAGAKVERSRYVAERIPGARLLELPGTDRAAWSSGGQQVLGAIREFVDTVAHEATVESDRVLATVLFTDIVGSTSRAAELGDAAWRDLLQRHHAIVRRQLVQFRGREVDTAGDGFFAVFDGPARAIRCARAIVGAVAETGLEVRAGLHCGECELVDGKVAGIAVNVGARVAAQAAPSEVLVSSTVRDLVAGAGFSFEDRGETELAGVPTPWRLYAVSDGSSALPS